MEERDKVIETLAKEYGIAFASLQPLFDQAAETTSLASHWVWDGIHPTPAGHRLIADIWLRLFTEIRQCDRKL